MIGVTVVFCPDESREKRRTLGTTGGRKIDGALGRGLSETQEDPLLSREMKTLPEIPELTNPA